MVISILLSTLLLPVKAILAVPTRQHLVLGSVVFLFCLWLGGVKLENDWLRIHLLGITVITLLIGWAPSILAGTAALLVITAMGITSWPALGINFALSVLIPASISQLWLLLISKARLNNLFIYMLGGGFFGAVFSRLFMALALYLLAQLAPASSPLAEVTETYLPYLLLSAFPEGFINGTILSAVTIYFPHWVRSFDDKRYLDSK